MTLLLLILFVTAAFGTAVWLTERFRSYALRANIVDQVSKRSSHTAPTPRGGGGSVVLVGTLGFVASPLWLGFPTDQAIGIAGGAITVALVGWIDDHRHLSPGWRLLAHLAAAVWAVWWIGPFDLQSLPLPLLLPEILAPLLSVVGVVWLINLFNFMDGIDGIAGSEAVCVALGASLLLWAEGYGISVTAPFLILAAAALGFLYWNWPPAKVFMGDAGSGFLGFSLAALALVASQLDSAFGVAIIILLGVFISDATVTLLRRAARREPVHQAHRTHAYQRLARIAGRHLPVTLAVIAVNMLVLLPLGWLAASGTIMPLAALLSAYVLLVIAALVAGAGRVEQ